MQQVVTGKSHHITLEVKNDLGRKYICKVHVLEKSSGKHGMMREQCVSKSEHMKAQSKVNDKHVLKAAMFATQELKAEMGYPLKLLQVINADFREVIFYSKTFLVICELQYNN